MFRAYDPDRDRLVAVKLFRLDLPPERVHQVVAELEALVEAGLTHPVLVAPRAAGISGVSTYLVQDFVAADSLDSVLREYGPAPVPDAIRVTRQLAEALDSAAAAGIAHGALHPRDILLSPDDTRLTGVGVARALERAGVPTPLRRPYTAPERAAGGGAAWDRRADVFSLAVIAHDLVWGRRLAGVGEKAAETLTEIDGVDLAALRRVFSRALAEDPRHRFQTALAFVDALAEAFSQTSGRAPTMPPEGPAVNVAVRAAGPAAVLTPALSPVPAPAPDVPAGAVAPLSLREARLPLDEPDMEVTLEPVRLTRDEAAPPGGELDLRPSEFVSEGVGDGPDEERGASTGLRTLALTLVLGGAIGFAAGYGVGYRARPAAPSAASVESSRSSTETATSPPEAARPKVDSAPSTPVATPSPAPIVSGKAPASTARAGAAPGRAATSATGRTGVLVAPGRISVRSKPSGAQVFIDGRDVGRTPVTSGNLARGSHEVRVVRDGYSPVARRVTVTAAKPAPSVTVTLARPRSTTSPTATATPAATSAPAAAASAAAQAAARGIGSLDVDSRPSGARVFVDGRSVGTTPVSVDGLEAGEHAVRLEQDGYRNWTSSVRIVAGARNRVAASLER